MKMLTQFIKWAFWLVIITGTISAAALGVFLFELSKTLPQNLEDELHKRNDVLPTVLYDREGNQIEELFIQRRIVVPYEQFPPHLVQALVASEDSRFFSHLGIDPLRIPKAFLANLRAGRIVQGASTLTQQTARLFLLSREKQIVRKLREMLLAFRMEMQFSKQEILSLYLNKVYLGNAEGIEAASQGYFGKHAEELNLAESTLLVGILPAPSRYAPHVNPEFALLRRNTVLRRMRQEGFISEQELQKTSEMPISLIRIHDSTTEATSYYVEHVRRYLIKKYGSKVLYQGGLKVYLAMDLNYQTYAHEALWKGILELTKRQGFRGQQKDESLDNSSSTDNSTLDNTVKIDSLFLGNIVGGTVNEVSEKKVSVKIGKSSGTLEWNNIKTWRNGNILKDERPSRIAKPSEIFSTGDEIQVRLADYDTINNSFRLELYQEPLVNGALLAMDPKNGEVLSMSGGYRYGESEFNRAIQAQRQPGSSFKPIVYSAALDAGFTLSSALIDSPRAYATGAQTAGDAEIWTPKNYGDKIMGKVSLRTALVKSLNLPTIGLCEELKPKQVIVYSRRFGITADMMENLTTCLGSLSTTLQEMITAYGVFANQGRLVKPIYILRVEDQAGNTLESSLPEFKQVTSEETAFLLSNVLQDVVQTGTGRRARAIGRPSAGKTGTTNDSVDAWYIGYIPQLLTGVYVGFDKPRRMGRSETGSKAAAPIWIDFMKNAVTNLPTEQFKQPPGITTVKIHKSGRRAIPCDNVKEIKEEHYKTGTEPVLDLSRSGRCGQTVTEKTEKEESEPEL
ncbi:MAG: PBP1A family penicillin-binding protein [SAR324 cluster bacterium]|jgi:penicillin-binding protein 1A|nr:PBP1A family penicillin-binding protein [SAR324 cluster bacterium]HBR60616.1 penicillin-binding protein [Deltaproteobacteria bacterium]MDP7170416.1 PBP1A family penicillin-binding protein [SAR324 cluster bacterium]MDP7439772.1 PBP1A family penicillin-binding protein [SAR324 cluster bacterium]MDP7614189.1 PBP1A family penicillin-binding protein [SAR324 cluster bacterium]|tara:strand:+ start:112 stop:2493 length:2382 start_codon:yes stop_codon:yes gene_type:complete